MEGDPPMKVLVAGATGVLGRAIVPRLLDRGHEVVGTTRSRARLDTIARTGARGMVMDALDPDATAAALAEVRPRAVIHALTALPPGGPARPADLEATNRLRIEGTRNLLSSARAAGVERFLAESFIGVYGLGDGQLLTEESPLAEVHGPAAAPVEALRSLEEQVLEAAGIALRYGLLYGPSVPSTEATIQRLRRRSLPLPGGAPGVASWIHIHDAATATLAALDRAQPATVLNVVDDEPVAFGEYLAALALAVSAARPARVPTWLGRLVAPYATTLAVKSQLTVSNERLRRELDWQPTFATYREGLKAIASAG
jgi:nucleoside-diphosphate-sugar epimerase